MLKAAIVGFILMVIIPWVVSAIYLFVIASDQYSTEVSFAVRGGQSTVLESVGSNMAATSAALAIQDSMILADYVQSRTLVEDLQKRLDLRRMYSRPGIDYLWRFNPKNSIEDLVHYWKHRSEVSIDPMSGIVTIVVTAFTPKDSYDIAEGVIASSEDLVNKLTERARADALKQGQDELSRSEKRLEEKASALRAARESDGVFDPAQQAIMLTGTIKELRLELAGLEQSYAARLQTISPDAPQMKYTKVQIKTTREEIEKLEAQLAGADSKSPSGSSTVSSAMSNIDKAVLERTIAQQQYASASIAHARARVDAESQQMYLSTSVKPVMPDTALYPRRGWIWSAIAACSLVLWASCFGLAIFFRNYFDV